MALISAHMIFYTKHKIARVKTMTSQIHEMTSF